MNCPMPAAPATRRSRDRRPTLVAASRRGSPDRCRARGRRAASVRPARAHRIPTAGVRTHDAPHRRAQLTAMKRSIHIHPGAPGERRRGGYMPRQRGVTQDVDPDPSRIEGQRDSQQGCLERFSACKTNAQLAVRQTKETREFDRAGSPLISGVVAMLIVLVVGDFASTFFYHVPQHMWANCTCGRITTAGARTGITPFFRAARSAARRIARCGSLYRDCRCCTVISVPGAILGLFSARCTFGGGTPRNSAGKARRGSSALLA